MSLRDVGTVKDTTTITLFHPATGKDLLNADGTPMTVTVHGPYSERYKTVLRDQQQRRMTDMTRAAARTNMTPEEIDAFAQELMTRCIEDWSLTLEGDDKLPFSAEAATTVLAEFPWLRDQINAAIGDVAGFLEPSKKH
jgi:hypothetical protein